MLSYLKDENQTPAAAQMEAANADVTGEQGASGQNDYLKPASHAKNVRQGTIILVVLFLAGGAGVWWMIKQSSLSKAQGATEEETSQIDAVLAELNSFQSQMNDQMDSVSGRFVQASELGQITVSELKKNPFRQQWTPETNGESSDTETLLRKEQIRLRAGQLQLWSITEREQNSCCMIQDKVLYVGDTIQEFTVKEITADRVELVCEDVTVELKMQ